MKTILDVKHHALNWSSEDIEQHLVDFEELQEVAYTEKWETLSTFFHQLMHEVVEVNSDDIMEFISNRLRDHIYMNKHQIVSEIKLILDHEQ